MEQEWDEFIGEIREVAGCDVITIPKRNMAYSGLKTGDSIKVRYKKKQENN